MMSNVEKAEKTALKSLPISFSVEYRMIPV